MNTIHHFCLLSVSLQDTFALPLIGLPEFPARYHSSVRGLSASIRAARPGDVEELDIPITHQDRSRWMLKTYVNHTDLTELRREIARVERHLRRIRSLRGDINLKNFVPAQGIEHHDQFRLTTYASYYNIFFIESEAIGRLYWWIKLFFHKYAAVYKFDMSKIYFIHGWFNCFRGGGKISFHRHCNGVSGNMAVHVPPGSFTRYGTLRSSKEYHWMRRLQKRCQHGEKDTCERLGQLWRYTDDMVDVADIENNMIVMDNEDGDLVLFHGLVEHETSNVTEEMRQYLKQQGPTGCRMTLAFDIDTDPSELHHSVVLYDPQDPWGSKGAEANMGEDVGKAFEQIYERSNLPPIFDWDILPDERAFLDRMRAARTHPGSAQLSSWLKCQLSQGWAEFHTEQRKDWFPKPADLAHTSCRS
eukprot:TRINITY_DN19886_c0_g1_i1.p1 TRINITY_DN19886_c0_g1~~TRINITY_DN19886_c0_g1_i1.p1  ORF type:complete len:416 (-),score=61.45 TRINITY_DN19886_c0_g1_i1:14-1261(-)